MMFIGAKFCSHCGEAAERKELPATSTHNCPRCALNMRPVAVGKTELRECPRCEGIWVEATRLQQICTDRDKQAAVLGTPITVEPATLTALEKVRYVPCPDCRKLMNRVQFAKCSQVIVDVCRDHGTWCDKDELRRIVEFIRAGGFERTRDAQVSELKREKQRLNAARNARVADSRMDYGGGCPSNHGWGGADSFCLAELGASLLMAFFE
jgi:Zn-finger nucleic acid-binding protein